MNLLTFLRIILGSSATNTAKLSDASDAEESIHQEDSKTGESAVSVSEKLHSLAAHLTGKGGKTMTVDEAKQKLVAWCKSQVGYHEGYDGTNKYGADGDWDLKLYGFEASVVAWCDVFADYAFIHCFGYDDGTKMTYQQPSGYAACSLSADAYKRNGAYYYKPEVGDQIFFLYGGGINHTGIVISVNGDSIQCVEGNYSDSVVLTSYKLENQIIDGFGRPDWYVVAEPDKPVPDFSDVDDTQYDIIHPEHRTTALHLSYGDGIGNPLPQVKAWQNLLIVWGLSIGGSGADGEYGLDTENATRQWQQKVHDMGADVEVNGIVDEDDWSTIILVEGVD